MLWRCQAKRVKDAAETRPHPLRLSVLSYQVMDEAEMPEPCDEHGYFDCPLCGELDEEEDEAIV